MFLRTTRVKRSDGKIDEYIRLVESEWNNGNPRHRVICNLGRKELLAPHAQALLRLLQGKRKKPAREPRNGGGGSLGLGSDAGGAALLAAAGSARNYRRAGQEIGSEAGAGRPSSGAGDEPVV
jgi:hypothetical protein